MTSHYTLKCQIRSRMRKTGESYSAARQHCRAAKDSFANKQYFENPRTAVPLVKDAQARFPALRQCSFDRGYHSPENQKKLGELLEWVVLPVKGRGSQESRAYEATEAFVEARRQHPAVESAIHALECHGLSRIRNRGAERFERTVALSILAANCHRLGRLLQEAERARRACRKRYKQAA